MSFKPIQKLSVARTLSSGERVAVGVLAQNRQGVFFSVCRKLLAAVWQFIAFYFASGRRPMAASPFLRCYLQPASI